MHESRDEAAERMTTLAWIDSREAILVRLVDDGASVRRIVSEVPAHRRSTGHVRHDLSCGTGAASISAKVDQRRRGRLDAFLDDVMGRLPSDEDVLILGPGTLGRRRANRVRSRDAAAHAARRIDVVSAGG